MLKFENCGKESNQIEEKSQISINDVSKSESISNKSETLSYTETSVCKNTSVCKKYKYNISESGVESINIAILNKKNDEKKININNFINEKQSNINIDISDENKKLIEDYIKKYENNLSITDFKIIDCKFISKNNLNNKKKVLIKFPNGIYIGNFENYAINGFGKYIFNTGDIHIGSYKNGKLNGKGQLFFKSGSKYDGDFKDGKFNGNGTYTYKSGKKIIGIFENGKIKHNVLNAIKNEDKDDKKYNILESIKEESNIEQSINISKKMLLDINDKSNNLLEDKKTDVNNQSMNVKLDNYLNRANIGDNDIKNIDEKTLLVIKDYIKKYNPTLNIKDFEIKKFKYIKLKELCNYDKDGLLGTVLKLVSLNMKMNNKKKILMQLYDGIYIGNFENDILNSGIFYSNSKNQQYEKYIKHNKINSITKNDRFENVMYK